mmetsp:Transcript_39697/g.91973  ORF Transcript_39697/g.91973 Transcript_39697/m.91973 type:complete len:382 (-) Transcript_39697:671-1816(-)
MGRGRERGRIAGLRRGCYRSGHGSGTPRAHRGEDDEETQRTQRIEGGETNFGGDAEISRGANAEGVVRVRVGACGAVAADTQAIRGGGARGLGGEQDVGAGLAREVARMLRAMLPERPDALGEGAGPRPKESLVLAASASTPALRVSYWTVTLVGDATLRAPLYGRRASCCKVFVRDATAQSYRGGGVPGATLLQRGERRCVTARPTPQLQIRRKGARRHLFARLLHFSRPLQTRAGAAAQSAPHPLSLGLSSFSAAIATETLTTVVAAAAAAAAAAATAAAAAAAAATAAATRDGGDVAAAAAAIAAACVRYFCYRRARFKRHAPPPIHDGCRRYARCCYVQDGTNVHTPAAHSNGQLGLGDRVGWARRRWAGWAAPGNP